MPAGQARELARRGSWQSSQQQPCQQRGWLGMQPTLHALAWRLKAPPAPCCSPPCICRVATALVLLTTSPPAPLTDRLMAAPVTIVICREITMSALREWAAASGGGAHKVSGGARPWLEGWLCGAGRLVHRIVVQQ